MGRRCLGELAATHVDIGDVGQGGARRAAEARLGWAAPTRPERAAKRDRPGCGLSYFARFGTEFAKRTACAVRSRTSLKSPRPSACPGTIQDPPTLRTERNTR